MKVAIDKYTIGKIKDLKEHEYIYIYGDDEDYEDLLKLNIHCMHKDYAIDIDINLTRYNLGCYKKADINDKDWYKLPDKKNYRFAIIVPSYNNDHGEYKGKTFLQNCIESILNQTYKDFELIIVDDMSTDTSVETVEKYVDKRIHLIKNKRKRYNGGSRNVGIEYALENIDFDYFAFLDSDDWWKDNNVLEIINNRLYNAEMMTISCEMLGNSGTIYTSVNKPKCYEDLYSINNNLWCTAWARIIRKDKIVYFCEDTLMEDRVWTYRLADNLNYDNVRSITKVCYVWNRMNTGQSVSLVRNEIWKASAYCHIGHQLMLLDTLKHKEMIPILRKRLERCITKVSQGIYEQH